MQGDQIPGVGLALAPQDEQPSRWQASVTRQCWEGLRWISQV